MDHVTKKNKDELVPKLISNAQLTAKFIESCRNEIVEAAEFLKFHENLAAGEHVVNSECNFSAASTSRVNLDKIT